MASNAQTISTGYDPQTVEAMAVLRGIKYAKDACRDDRGSVLVQLLFQTSFNSKGIWNRNRNLLGRGLWPCVLEMDAQVVVNLVIGETVVRSDIGLVVDDVAHLLHEFLDCVVSFVHI
ncbi:hypothetical protein Ddye_025777 [Dipteronia dyeriana]|uniref:RNase H type-1 domain-containing protein n=1 Tax=Dipteronia dyeriana TaxID=168575 RepID=A0AAD9WPS2_9ROSI|nr:hypothetical protein Ddye_025777 [Dipteronia dyeriana]